MSVVSFVVIVRMYRSLCVEYTSRSGSPSQLAFNGAS